MSKLIIRKGQLRKLLSETIQSYCLMGIFMHIHANDN